MGGLQGVFLFILGLCVGSFLNVVVYRLNQLPQAKPRTGRYGAKRSTKRSGQPIPTLRREINQFLWGRSFCPQCKRKIVWHDNIPLLSFILLGGKCRSCHSPISWQYPLVELATGILFVMDYQGLSGTIRDYQGWISLAYYLFLTSALVTIFVSDLRCRTIPDVIVYPAMGVTVLFQLLVHLRGVSQAQHHLGGVFLAGLGAAGFFLLLVLATRGKGMGMGDVKLAGLMGLILAFPKIVVALFLAFLTGAIVGVILILLGRKRFGEEIPFGPFLAGATWMSLFWGDLIWQWYWGGVF